MIAKLFILAVSEDPGYPSVANNIYTPLDTGRPGRLLNVLCTCSLRPVSKGKIYGKSTEHITLSSLMKEIIWHQICKGSYKEKALQLTVRQVVPNQFDLLSNA